MCLAYFRDLPDKQMAKYKKNGYIPVWKVVSKNTPGVFSPIVWKKLHHRPGLQKAKGGEIAGIWYAGFYGFLSKKDAQHWLAYHIFKKKKPKCTIIKCMAKPAWIKVTGGTRPNYDNDLQVVIFTHLVFPQFPRERVTVREFRRIIKGTKNESN